MAWNYTFRNKIWFTSFFPVFIQKRLSQISFLIPSMIPLKFLRYLSVWYKDTFDVYEICLSIQKTTLCDNLFLICSFIFVFLLWWDLSFVAKYIASIKKIPCLLYSAMDIFKIISNIIKSEFLRYSICWKYHFIYVNMIRLTTRSYHRMYFLILETKTSTKFDISRQRRNMFFSSVPIIIWYSHMFKVVLYCFINA